MAREIRQPPVSVHRRDLVYRPPHHVRAVKIFSEWSRGMVHQITSNSVKMRDLARRFRLPVLSCLHARFLEKPVEQVAVVQLFNAPAVHKLFDDRVFARRRSSQFLVIHVSEILDVAHVDQHRHKRWIQRMIFDVIPANVVDVLFR
jgi:hypothetical protein